MSFEVYNTNNGIPMGKAQLGGGGAESDGAIYQYMGSVATYAALELLDTTNFKPGYVYDVQEDGMDYSWTGTEWNALGTHTDLSNYYTKDQTYAKSETYSKTEEDELLGGKQDSFEAQAPIITSNGIGKVYNSTGVEYEGTVINRRAYLFQYPSQNSIPGVDTIGKSWELRYDNVFIKEAPQSLTTIISVYPGVHADRSIIAYLSNSDDNLLHAESTLTGSYAKASAAITYNEYYDFRITYDGSSAVSIQYKLSSDTNWTTVLTSYEHLLKRDFKVQLSVDGNSSVIGDLKGVTFTNDGVVLFERTINKLSLSIGAGLSVDGNGNLVNTNPTPVDVSNKVTGVGISEMQALTQTEYDEIGKYYAYAYNGTTVYVRKETPTTTDTVYSAIGTASALTITSVGTDSLTLSDGNTYTRSAASDEIDGTQYNATTLYVVKNVVGE